MCKHKAATPIGSSGWQKCNLSYAVLKTQFFNETVGDTTQKQSFDHRDV